MMGISKFTEEFLVTLISSIDGGVGLLVGVLFLFLGLLVALFFSGLIGSWLRSDNQIFALVVFIFILIGIPPLLLVGLSNLANPSVALLSLYDNNFITPAGISYSHSFFLNAEGFLLNSLPVFKGIWFDLIGGVDRLAIIFILMVHIVALMTIAFSFLYSGVVGNYRQSIRDVETFRITIFSVLLMSFCLDILFLTTNLVIMFILAELTLLPLSFLMLKDNTVFWRSLFSRFDLVSSASNSSLNKEVELRFENKRPLAFYYLIFFTIVSGGLGLFGISLIYLTFGSTSLVTLSSIELSRHFLDYFAVLTAGGGSVWYSFIPSSLTTKYLVLTIGLFLLIFWISVKVPLAPVHIWLPKAHVEGSTESSMILAGIILKITVYILIRVLSLPFFFPLFLEYKSFFLSIAVVTAIVGAFGALLTTDLKRIVAYSSVSHMGIIMSAGFFIVSNSISLLPFLILLLTHTVVSTAMFMMVGCVYKSRYSQFISRNKLVYGGLLYIFPNFFLFGIIIFANLNIPMTMGFVGELGTLIAVVQSGLTIGVLLCLGAFILLLPMVSMLGQVLMGPLRSSDVFKLFSAVNVDYFAIQSVFNGVSWSSQFLKFYYSQYLYFLITVAFVVIFGFCPFLFAAYFELFSIEQAGWFSALLNSLSS